MNDYEKNDNHEIFSITKKIKKSYIALFPVSIKNFKNQKYHTH